MKKILFCLFFFFNLLFSSTYVDTDGTCYNPPEDKIYTQYATNTTCDGKISAYCTSSYCYSACNENTYTYLPQYNYHAYSNSTYFKKTDSTSSTCPPPPTTVLSSSQTEHGSTIVDFDDGAKMIIFPDLTAFTFDVNGNLVPNYAFNGTTPPASTPFSDTYAPNTNYKAKSFLENLFFSGNGTPLLSPAPDGTLRLPVFVATDMGGIQFSPLTDTSFTKSGEKITKTPAPTSEHPNAVSIDVTSMNFDNVDFSEYENKATTTPQTVPNTNIVIERVGTTNQVNTPAIPSGTVIAHNGNDYSQFIATTPTTLSIGSQATDGTVTQTTFNRSDITNTLTNLTDLPFVTQTITPPVIQSNGTNTQTTTTISQGSSNPVTGTQTTTNPTTGTTTTTTNPTTGTSTTAQTTSPSGTGTIDLSGVTSRLDKISNQITKVNDFNDGLNKITPSTINHGIPSVPTEFENWNSTWDNLKSDFDNVLNTADELKNIVSGEALTLQLSKSSITECPYTLNFDYGAGSAPITVDLCKSFAPLRPIIYLFTYSALVLSILLASFKILLLMAV